MNKEIENGYNKAGKILTKNIPVVGLDETVGGVEKYILKNINSFDSINYIYIVDSFKKIRGVISIKELYRQEKDKEVKKVMQRELITSRFSTNQERIAYQALKNNIKAVPVTDKEGLFLGVVQSDHILNVLYDEVQKDMLQMAGVIGHRKSFDDTMKISVFVSFKHRFPWLLLGLFGGLVIAKIIHFFESTLSENLIIAAFIPLMVYMASAVGTQMAALIIRDLALNPGFKFFNYFLKQFLVVFLIAALSSLVFLLINIAVGNGVVLAYVLAIAMFVAIISSLFTGLIVPYTLGKLRIDPANASGPLGTIIQDTLTVVIYFSVVTVLF